MRLSHFFIGHYISLKCMYFLLICCSCTLTTFTPLDMEIREKKYTLQEFPRLPALLRFYFYGIQGFCDEIVFTAFFDFFHEKQWTLKGHSAISSFFIYGSCSFLVERLYVFLYYKHGVRWYWRLPLYLCICYTWEFCMGSILRLFDACPWDYSHYTYNFKGLITLEYAPGWLFLSWAQDVMADYLLRLRVAPSTEVSTLTEGETSLSNGFKKSY